MKIGEILEADVCIPKNTKPPLSLQIQGSNNIPIEVATLKSFQKLRKQCPLGQYRVLFNWKIDRSGAYTLYVYSKKENKTFYPWPEGIDVSEEKESNKVSSQNPSKSKVNSVLYNKGAAMVLETSQESLVRQGFLGIFGATGQPIKSKALNWCKGMQTMFPPYLEDKEVTQGCLDAAMTLYRK